MMCPTFLFILFVGAFCERPRANTVRPYESLIDQDLLARLFDRNGNAGGHTNLGVVTCADESHHLYASEFFGVLRNPKAL